MKLSDKIFYYILKIIQKIIIYSPVFLIFIFGRILGLIGYYILPSRRNITIDNLNTAFPDKKRSWARKTARNVYMNFGRNIMEMIKYSAGKYFDHVQVKGFERFSATEAAILFMGHIGNWEIAGMNMTASGLELNPIGRKIHSKALNKIVDEMRSKYGSEHIHYKGSLRKLLKKIKESKILCILIDQRMRSGLPVTFFGRPVWASHVISVLHRKTGVKVIPGYTRHSKKDVLVNYGAPMDLVSYSDGLKTDFINTQRQISWLEKIVSEKPDEWFWLHNFWKTTWPVIFLDRDNTINVDKGYVHKEEDLEFLPGVLESLRELRRAGYLLIIITNQSGIARGYYSEADYELFNKMFIEKLLEEGVIIDHVYHCPHHPDANCDCRKPNTALIHQACKDYHVEVDKSYMIGDKSSDVEFGVRSGLKSIILGDAPTNFEALRFKNLSEAAEHILLK